ncbi:uncharacterized protein LOC134230705 isoform X1 [Saccostrea cucullata]|uniref:uncharacterized protein LOC134230705 isoform X1 n=1 Tax=Saccostrea cuccullata TaxID=36930 RepID=UPI002ED407FD
MYEMDEETGDTWKDLLDGELTSHSGFVTSSTKLDKLLQEYDYATSSRFRCIKSSKEFGKDVDVGRIDNAHIRFVDTQGNAEPQIEYDAIPFIIMGKRVLECHQGYDRDKRNNKKKKMKSREDKASDQIGECNGWLHTSVKAKVSIY